LAKYVEEAMFTRKAKMQQLQSYESLC
jgi:hypothetical protein